MKFEITNKIKMEPSFFNNHNQILDYSIIVDLEDFHGWIYLHCNEYSDKIKVIYYVEFYKINDDGVIVMKYSSVAEFSNNEIINITDKKILNNFPIYPNDTLYKIEKEEEDKYDKIIWYENDQLKENKKNITEILILDTLKDVIKDNGWSKDMYDLIGKKYVVIDKGHGNYYIKGNWGIPYHCAEEIDDDYKIIWYKNNSKLK